MMTQYCYIVIVCDIYEWSWKKIAFSSKCEFRECIIVEISLRPKITCTDQWKTNLFHYKTRHATHSISLLKINTSDTCSSFYQCKHSNFEKQHNCGAAISSQQLITHTESQRKTCNITHTNYPKVILHIKRLL